MHVSEKSQSDWQSGLTPSERVCLFQIATDTLAACVCSPEQEFSYDAYPLTAALRQPQATFVTLHRSDGTLRGCIGTLEPVAPLFQSVHENTVSAALRDPRFTPVQPNELADIRITLSLLSAPKPIAVPEEFTAGVEGIILEKHGARAVFLPEVAAEQGWTREETLDALCMKAGLSPGAWRSEARLSIFFTSILSGSSP